MDAPLKRTVEHERVANEAKHWVRLTAACNSKCVFCLDAEAQDGRFMSFEDICREIDRGREDKGATRLVVSGGEATIHPRFHDCVRYGKQAGYRWVQTVTNGQKLADRDFFLRAVDAGLDEITFSLHGHTAALHDRLTKTKNGFDNLMKAMIRAVRDGRVVVNVDVCINRQNVEHLEQIVALCARVGVKEFDLLHVIPQGVAFDHREALFYDPDQHADALRRVFQLARRSDFHIWTNRFPLAHLEDVEELIQDPHKMLDEVGGRRVQFRRYLDRGEPIDCRDARRCPHCFIEPFCSSLDRHVRDQHAAAFDVWWVGDRHDRIDAMPCGARFAGVQGVPPDAKTPLYVRGWKGEPLPPGSRIVSTELLDTEHEVELHLDRDLCEQVLARGVRPNWILHAPTRATMEEAARLDPDWAAFFRALPPGARAQNLPACLCPGARLERPLRVLDAHLFHDDGRLAIDAFVERYVEHEYRAKSLRCRQCPADAFCEGGHVQSLRAHGFRQLRPLPADRDLADVRAAWSPGPRLAAGVAPQPASVRVEVAGNPPVPFVDTAPGRRS
ncbi:MAG: radical SAM protein [Myxococcota bacterium]